MLVIQLYPVHSVWFSLGLYRRGSFEAYHKERESDRLLHSENTYSSPETVILLRQLQFRAYCHQDASSSLTVKEMNGWCP